MSTRPLLAALVAGALAATAVGLAWPYRYPGPRLPSRARRRQLRLGWAAGVTVPVVAAVWMPERVVLVVIIVAAAAAIGGVLRVRKRAEALVRAQGEVAGFCQAVAAEVRAGVSPGPALSRASAEWPRFASIAAANRLGGDVPGAFRALAAAPGYADLALVGAAWQLAQQSGGGLGRALARVAATLRADAATRRVVRAELASARSTARLLAVLPGFALLMGRGIGGDPLGFLFGTPAGLACLAGGLALLLAGLAWIERIAASVWAGS